MTLVSWLQICGCVSTQIKKLTLTKRKNNFAQSTESLDMRRSSTNADFQQKMKVLFIPVKSWWWVAASGHDSRKMKIFINSLSLLQPSSTSLMSTSKPEMFFFSIFKGTKSKPKTPKKKKQLVVICLIFLCQISYLVFFLFLWITGQM